MKRARHNMAKEGGSTEAIYHERDVIGLASSGGR